MKPRGASLASTLVFTALALLVGLALASSSIAHLHFASSQSHREAARAAAEGAIGLAMEKLLHDPAFGAERLPEHSVSIDFDGAVGRLSFDKSTAGGWNLPYSTNNRASDSPVPGDRQLEVPPAAVHLIAQGQAGGIQKTLEVVVVVPDFPYALASSGRIESQGSLLIGGLENLEDAFPELPRADLGPADLASNAPGEAIVIDGEAQVIGNIQAVGTISLSEDVSLRGELKPLSDPIPIANLDLQSLKPSGSSALADRSGAVVKGSKHVLPPPGQAARFEGGLSLSDGVLFVDGDLEISGGVRGKGALLVNGSVLIEDGASLAADNQFAIIAKGDVEVRGGAAHRPFFQGLIYTEGDLIAQDATLLGSFVANKPSSAIDPGSRVSLADAGLVHLPAFGKFETEARKVRFRLSPDETGSHDDASNVFNDLNIAIEMNATKQEFEDFVDWQRKQIGAESESNAAQSLALAAAQAQIDKYGMRLVDLVTNREWDLTSTSEDWTINQNPEENHDPRSVFANLLDERGIEFIDGDEFDFETQEPVFHFELNEFVDEVHRARIVMWKET